MENVNRPAVAVLADASQIPERNLIRPPPNCFTHRLTVEQPYRYFGPMQSTVPVGRFAAGTRVILMHHDGGAVCRVVDHQGLYVETAFSGLVPDPQKS